MTNVLGTLQVILDTATDADVGENDVTTRYNIISGNERGDFTLVLLEASKPLLYLENTRVRACVCACARNCTASHIVNLVGS